MTTNELKDLAKWIENNCDGMPLIFIDEKTQKELEKIVKF